MIRFRSDNFGPINARKQPPPSESSHDPGCPRPFGAGARWLHRCRLLCRLLRRRDGYAWRNWGSTPPPSRPAGTSIQQPTHRSGSARARASARWRRPAPGRRPHALVGAPAQTRVGPSTLSRRLERYMCGRRSACAARFRGRIRDREAPGFKSRVPDQLLNSKSAICRTSTGAKPGHNSVENHGNLPMHW